jgi:AraC family transcriptional regulator
LAHHDGLHDPRISTLIRLMEFEVTAGCPTGRLYGESLSAALLSYLTSRYSVTNEKREEGKSTLSRKKLQIVMDYIYSHLNSNISLTELSGLIPTSAYTFCRLFRNTTGVTPHQYLIGVRIEEAKRFLAEGKRSIAEVSLLLGFANQSHFTRTFGRITGISPRRYRYENLLN